MEKFEYFMNFHFGNNFLIIEIMSSLSLTPQLSVKIVPVILYCLAKSIWTTIIIYKQHGS